MASESTAIGNVYEMRVHGRIENQEYINVIHFQSIDAGRDLVEDLLIVAYLCFLEQLVPIMGDKFTLEKVTGKRVAPDVGPEWEHAGGGADVRVGQAEGDTLPSFVSIRCNIRCTRGGRSGRGAIALAGIPDAATDGSSIVDPSTFWTGLQAWLDCMRNAFLQGFGLGTKHFLIGVVSRKLGNAKPPYLTAQFSTAVSMQLKNRVGSQNSRKIGHGS